MRKQTLAERIIQLVVGTLVISLGISFQLKADIGVSPISSLPYVISKCTYITVGTWLMLWNALFTFLEAAILRENFKKIYWLQVPLAFLIGYGTDLTNYLLHNLPVLNYGVSLLYCIIGIFITALGIYLTVSANLIMNGPEAFQHAISTKYHMEFGYVRVGSDVTMMVLASVVSWLLYQRIVGVREGTILAAVFTGLVVKWYKRIFHRVKDSKNSSHI